MGPALLLAAFLGLQDPASAGLKLDRIEVVGVKRYTAAEVIRLSGLAPGQVVTNAGVQQAGQQLVGTGLFKSLRYRHEVTDGGVALLTFQVEEEEWKTPVVFDNLLWFADDELTAAVRAEVPSFEGTSPATEAAAAFIGRALQRIIEARGIPGQVQFRDRFNVRTGGHQFVYRVNRDGLHLCALRLPGASAPLESLLQQASKDDVIGKDYSRAFLIDFAEGTLRQIYLNRGFLKAGFGTLTAALNGSCQGITVTLAVNEGPAYAWASAEWIGGSAITPKDLDGLLGMKRGQVSDLSKINEGLRAVQAAYDKLGFLERRLSVAPRLDDAARTAVFAITVAEGAQYRMGTIEFLGFTAAKTADLLKRWRLKSGDIFDSSYQPQFEREQFLSGGLRVTGERRINTGTHTVDVRFTLK